MFQTHRAYLILVIACVNLILQTLVSQTDQQPASQTLTAPKKNPRAQNKRSRKKRNLIVGASAIGAGLLSVAALAAYKQKQHRRNVANMYPDAAGSSQWDREYNIYGDLRCARSRGNALDHLQILLETDGKISLSRNGSQLGTINDAIYGVVLRDLPEKELISWFKRITAHKTYHPILLFGRSFTIHGSIIEDIIQKNYFELTRFLLNDARLLPEWCYNCGSPATCLAAEYDHYRGLHAERSKYHRSLIDDLLIQSPEKHTFLQLFIDKKIPFNAEYWLSDIGQARISNAKTVAMLKKAAGDYDTGPRIQPLNADVRNCGCEKLTNGAEVSIESLLRASSPSQYDLE
jgi:hypothetical protein